MKGLLTTFKKDMKLATRSFYMYVVLGFAFLFIFIMLFSVPEEMSGDLEIMSGKTYLAAADKTELAALTQEFSKTDEVILVDSRADVVTQLEDNRTATGLFIDFVDGKVVYEYILQGYESSSTRALIKNQTLSETAKALGMEANTTSTYLNGQNAEKMSMRDFLIPIFIVMESALMGLFLVAAYVFIEKNEGTIRAYTVSPGRMWQFVLSKMMMFMVFGWVSGLITMFALKGFDFNLWQFVLLLTVYNAFGTIFGLVLAAFFNDFQTSMIWILVVASIFAVTTVSYATPSFSPLFIRLLPTYPMQFAFREVLFPTGNTGFVLYNILGFLAADVVLFFATVGLYKKRVSRF